MKETQEGRGFISFENATQAEREYVEKRIRNEVGPCQSALVDSLLRAGFEGFELENIENLDYTPEECAEDGIDPEDGEQKEVFEWWVIQNSFLLEDLRERGYPVLSNDFGDWMGRTTTGQALALDRIFWEVFQDGLKYA